MKSYILNSELLNGVALARGLTNLNFRLRNVYVWDTDEKRYYMATNGHIMFVATSELKSYDIRIEKPLALLYKGTVKARKREDATLHIDDEGKAEFITLRENKEVSLVNCEPPEHWKDCIPPENSPKLEVYCCFNPDYLGRIRKFIGSYLFTRPQTTNNDGRSPVVWFAGNKIAVIMPIKVD